jgi:hypothetical protein
MGKLTYDCDLPKLQAAMASAPYPVAVSQPLFQVLLKIQEALNDLDYRMAVLEARSGRI